MYDTSPEEMRAIRERAKMRQELKAEWTKKFTDPWKGAHPGGAIVRLSFIKFQCLERLGFSKYPAKTSS